MEDIEQNLRYSFYELDEILKNLPKKYTNMLPESFIEIIKSNKIKNDFKYDNSITLDNQLILHDTKIILSILYRTYWCSKEKKKKLEEEDYKILQEKYSNNIFQRQEIKNEQQIKELIIIENNENWYKKIIKFLKKLIKK